MNGLLPSSPTVATPTKASLLVSKNSNNESINSCNDNNNNKNDKALMEREATNHDDKTHHVNKQRKTNHEFNANNITSSSSSSSSSSGNNDNAAAGSSLILLMVCATGICTCYLYYSIIQEQLFSRDGGSLSAGVGTTITTFLLTTQTMTNVLVAYLWKYVEDRWCWGKEAKGNQARDGFKKEEKEASSLTEGSGRNDDKLSSRRAFGLNHSLLLLTAFCYFAAMTASNESLHYVSYPTVVLAKSSKLIPTMLMGSILERHCGRGSSKTYTRREWIGACLITCGIILFNISRMGNNHRSSSSSSQQQQQQQQQQEERRDSPYGLFLLFFSLAMDGILGSCQSLLKRRYDYGKNGDDTNQQKSFITTEQDTQKQTFHRPPTAIETMLYVNLYATLFLLPASVYSGQFHNGMVLLGASNNNNNNNNNMSVIRSLLALNLTSAMGQIFIFFTITFYSPLMCTTVTTTRKFFTILLSVHKFGHVLSVVEWLCVGMVFGGLYMEIASKVITERQAKKRAVVLDSSSGRGGGGGGDADVGNVVKVKVQWLRNRNQDVKKLQ